MSVQTHKTNNDIQTIFFYKSKYLFTVKIWRTVDIEYIIMTICIEIRDEFQVHSVNMDEYKCVFEFLL